MSSYEVVSAGPCWALQISPLAATKPLSFPMPQIALSRLGSACVH